MFYEINDWEIINSSNFKISENYIELDFSETELELIFKKYDYIDWKLIKWNKAIELEEKIIQEKISEINQEFNQKIKDYNSKYPDEEQKMFAEKIRKAENILSWLSDLYIEKKAESLWISAIKYAELIKQKASLFEEFYIECEIERDLKISQI